MEDDAAEPRVSEERIDRCPQGTKLRDRLAVPTDDHGLSALLDYGEEDNRVLASWVLTEITTVV